MRDQTSQFDRLETELLGLADACLRDDISDEQLARLDILVSRNPTAQQIYLHCIQDGLVLTSWASNAQQFDLPLDFGGPPAAVLAQTGLLPTPVPHDARPGGPIAGFLETALDWATRGRVSPRMLVIGIAAMLSAYFVGLLIMLGVERAWVRHPGNDQRLAESGAPTVAAPSDLSKFANSYGAARLVFADQCRWEKGSASPAVGQPLDLGSLHLLVGTAEIEFACGARVRITGPVKFDLKSATLGFLGEGRLSARVPARGRGFTIDTPSARLVDLGTAFIVEVNRATTRMAVIEGAVEVRPTKAVGSEAGKLESGGGAHLVALGQAMTISRTDAGTVTATPEPFDAAWADRNPPPGELLLLSPAAESQDDYYRRVIGTPDLIAYWRLDERGGQFARDEIGHDARPGGLAPGVYHNMRSADFQQPGPLSADLGAVRFDGTNYVEMRDRGGRLCGDWDGLTVTAWINPGDCNDSQDVRLIAGNWAEIVSQDQFILYQSADQVRFVVGDGKTAETSPWPPNRVPLVPGKWAFISGTWDKQTRALHFYVNAQDNAPQGAHQDGNGINQTSITSFCIGGQLGNSRFFVGLIDEVAIFKRCLSSREIAQLFAASAPSADIVPPVTQKNQE